MEYKEILEELKNATTEYDGLLMRLHDPFHNHPGKIECSETLVVINIMKKFASKLYEDIKDENVIKILDQICISIGETYLNSDIEEYSGTEYDLAYALSDLNPNNLVEIKKEPTYEVYIKKPIKNDNKNISDFTEDRKSFFFYSDAKKYFDDYTKQIKEFAQLVINKEDKIETKENMLVEIRKVD